MKIKAVVDYIQDGRAIIKFVNFKGDIVLPESALPKGTESGTILLFSVEAEKKMDTEIDQEIISIIEELNDDE